jgi:hypothetical protein
MYVTAQRRRRRGLGSGASGSWTMATPYDYQNQDPSVGPVTPGNPSIFDLPGGVNLQNLTTGTLSPSQVAILQSQGAASIQQVYDNTAKYYGADSPAAQAVAAILPAQIAGVYSDISALNPQPSLTDPTTWPWYIWAAGAVGLFLLVRR